MVSGHLVLLLLILLAAFALRVWSLTGVPPGLTHDEANHGREAVGILNGVLLFFFPLNYGSEPLYSYTVALFMAALGKGVFALRLVNAVFSTAAVAVTYTWAAPRLGRPTALLGAALMAVSFWPVAAGREALRAGMLPFFMALAVWAFWQATADRRPPTARQTTDNRRQTTHSRISTVDGETNDERRTTNDAFPAAVIGRRSAVAFFGLALALTLYTYLAARVSWLLFPVFLGYLALFHPAAFRRAWRPALTGLLLAGLLVLPMFLYLRAHPEMQTRLDMLDRPLQAVAVGDLTPVVLNVRDALLGFVRPGFGDQFLAYNIPGRPVLDAVSAVFFVLGAIACLWWWRRPAHAFLLLWFLIGILPSLITGPTANTTRNAAALPALYLIVATGVMAAGQAVADRRRPPADRSKRVTRHLALATLLILWVAFVSARDYFGRWGDSAVVRGAYQHTLVESIRHLTAHYPDADPVLFSTVYPGPAHDSSIALVLAAGRPAVGETARWVDARYALVVPTEETMAVIPYSTPPHPAFTSLLGALETVDLRPDDLDPRFTIYQIDAALARTTLLSGLGDRLPVNFNGAIELIGTRWLTESARPGETAELLTVWRVLDPTQAGPVSPPSFTTDAVLFTHVMDDAGGILAQRDALDAPSWAWQPGDLVLQIHPVAVPASAAPGEYDAVVGFYDRATGARLPVVGGGDTAAVSPLSILP